MHGLCTYICMRGRPFYMQGFSSYIKRMTLGSGSCGFVIGEESGLCHTLPLFPFSGLFVVARVVLCRLGGMGIG